MEFRTGSIDFAKDKGSGPRTATAAIQFGSQVTSAQVVLTGTQYGFSPNSDHHLGRVTIKVDSAIQGQIVTVTATLGVRDWSGNWDDDYEGTVEFAVLAEVV